MTDEAKALAETLATELRECARAQMVDEELWTLRCYYEDTTDPAYSALCDMIERYEQPPVDRKLLCAREAISHGSPTLAEAAAEREINHCIRAIELWESGYGA